jgi:hypothetical protein
MLSPDEYEEIRGFIHQEMASIEQQVRHQAGSYNYLCCVGGLTMFTHHPVGAVIHAIPHFD